MLSAQSSVNRIPQIILVTVIASCIVFAVRLRNAQPLPGNSNAWEDENTLGIDIKERLKPRDLEMRQDDATNQTVATERQFFHLHHMKTGGTSINQLMSCALRRFRPLNEQVPFYSLSECSGKRYQQCVKNENNTCRPRVKAAATMTYCAPLFQSNQFGWEEADAVTVIRHPVDRVWSMFRFRTSSCYQCRNLTDVYAELDKTGITEGARQTCQVQLMNHQTRNLLTSPMSEKFTEEDQLAEALHNIKNRFTIVGLTEELPAFSKMLGHTFPWLAEHLDSAGNEHKNDCPLPHANASPKNNRCGPNHSHWNLPDHPDEETRQAILDHNQMDLKVYEAAVERFKLQKQAFGWAEESG